MPEPAAGLLVDEQVQAAITASHLRGLPPDVMAQLLAGARRSTVAAGRTLHRVGDDDRHVELVVAGLVRVHATAPDGRTLTVRYCRRGALMGILSLYAEPFVMPVTTQVVVAADLLNVDPTVLRGLADRDVRVARALLYELSERADGVRGRDRWLHVRHRATAGRAASARPRHPEPPDGELVAALTQQELADAVGTVREVVVRTLRELRRDDVIETGRRGIRIHAPEHLLAEAYPSPGRRWNTGP